MFLLGEIIGQYLAVAVQHMDIAINEGDRIVQLVGDARDQPAEARHLLLFDQLALRLLQFQMRAVQGLIGAAQFPDRAPRQHRADTAARMVEPAGKIDRHYIGRTARGVKMQFAIACPRAGLAPRARAKMTARLIVVFLHDEIEQSAADQFRLGLAEQSDEGRIGLQDHAVLVAHHQNVGNRGDHAGDEALRFLEFGVLAFEVGLVAQKIGIDLVHAADDVAPDQFLIVGQFALQPRSGQIEDVFGTVPAFSRHQSCPCAGRSARSWRAGPPATGRGAPPRG